jgi:3-methylcrotonyl-CoA carboxylase alpha subunit
MNTRLQVEHPVTEMITGLDLVEWQLRVARGEALPKGQDQLAIHGHAIEARVYAENPDKGFLPSVGILRHLRTPQSAEFESGAGAGTPGAVRIDSGVRQGDAISPFYDPMIAKLIVWGHDRKEALARLSQALAQFQVVGVASNIAFLKRLADSEAFADARLDTGLIERHHAELFPAPQQASRQVLALAAAALLMSEAMQASADNDPWSDASGWRLNGTLRRQLDFSDESVSYPVTIAYRRSGWSITHGGEASAMTVLQHDRQDLLINLSGETVRGTVVRDADRFDVFYAGMQATLNYADPLAHAGEAESEAGRLTAPMPGKIVAVLAGKGETVEKGAPLLIMEAMKMEHTIAAPSNGMVEQLLYAVGDQVAEGAQLLVFTPV